MLMNHPQISFQSPDMKERLKYESDPQTPKAQKMNLQNNLHRAGLKPFGNQISEWTVSKCANRKPLGTQQPN